MSEIIIDVHNRCTRLKCKCVQEKHLLTASAGPVKGLSGLKYCTHRAIGDAKISNAVWRGEELEVLRYIDQFRDAESITVYYYQKRATSSTIRKPLLVRVKNSYDHKVYWYENLGHSANKKWRRFYQYESENYPKDYKQISGTQLEKKLRDLICALYLYHAIHIYPIKNEHEITCQICHEHINVLVTDQGSKISGYNKRTYKSFIDSCILVYDGNPVSFRKRSSETWKGYFVPIQIGKENVMEVSIHYWDGDTNYKRPLLLEIVGTNGISYWLENFSKDEKAGEPKHDKWRYVDPKKPGGNLDGSTDRRARLSVLNCIYNRTVQVKLGDTICHDPQFPSTHKNGISYSYDVITNTYPPIYSHTYESNDEFKDKSFNVSEICVGDVKQNFTTGLPFIDVKRLNVYVSPCDKDKPFLICIQYSDSSMVKNETYDWYYRKERGTTWEKYDALYKEPNSTKNEILSLFGKVSNDLNIGECKVSTSNFGFKLELTKTPVKGESYVTYYDDSSLQTKNTPIIVTKDTKNLQRGFFKNIHKATTDVGYFTLDRRSKAGGEIGRGTQNKIEGVESVEVHFWNGEPETPILVTVIRKNAEHIRHGRGPGSINHMWMNSQVSNMTEHQALDHQNCKLHDAIPIDLTNPINLKQFFSHENPGCVSKRFVVPSIPQLLPQGADIDYKVESYDLLDDRKRIGKTRVSRVIFDKKDTDIVSTNEIVNQINVYTWKNDSGQTVKIPLLVEFKKSSGGSDWFENLGKDSIKWRIITNGDEQFYKDEGIEKEFTENLTKKLNEVNCRVHGVVQIDISRTNEEPYCHIVKIRHVKNVKVTKEQTSKYSGFTGYEHTSALNDPNTMTISSFYNGKDKQELSGFGVLKKVSKVTVYYPNCLGGSPVAIQVQLTGGEKWFKRTNHANKWDDATDKFKKENGDIYEIRNILDEIKDETGACNPPEELRVQLQPSQGSAGDQDDDYDEEENKDRNNFLKRFFSDDTGDYEDVKNNFDNDEHDNETIKAYVTQDDFVRPSNAISPAKLQLSPTHSHLHSNPPGIVIDIKRDLISGKTSGSESYQSESNDIQLVKVEDDPHGFYRFTHWISNGESFEITKVMYGPTEIPDIKPKEPITSYSVWYWTKDEKMKEPLLIEMEGNNGMYTYKYSKGNSGSSWNTPYGKPVDGDESQLTDEPLEKELDDLNCLLNQAVTIDISKKVLGQYCCNGHSGTEKVRVNSGNITITSRSIAGVNAASIPYQKHSMVGGGTTKSAKIKYYDINDEHKTNRKRVISRKLDLPIPGPVYIYTFYCDDNPKLMYVENNVQYGVKGWYKKGETDEEQWERVDNELKGVTPTNARECKNWTAIKNVLGCIDGNCYKGPGTRYDGTEMSLSFQPDPQVIVKLDVKPKDDGDHPTYNGYESTEGQNITIKVKRSSYPNTGEQDFYKYTHVDSVSSGSKPFKLLKIEDDNSQSVISGTASMDSVTSVSAYYWRHEVGSKGLPEKALMVEIQNSSGKKYIYYTKTTSGWEKYDNPTKSGDQLTEEQLLNKLTLLNCDINDVVQIDVTKISYYNEHYCHNGDIKSSHINRRVKVEDVTCSNLGMYKAFEHKSITGGKLIISSIKKGGSEIKIKDINDKLPIKDAKNVVVYFCRHSLRKTPDPILIYIDSDSLDVKNKWFKKPTNINDTWTLVSKLNEENKSDSNAQAIVGFLDTITSPCKPPEVTIDIYRVGTSTSKTVCNQYIDMDSNKMIEVTNNNTKGFTEYIHRVQSRDYFILKQVNYNGQPTHGIENGSMNKVKSVSVYYWSGLERETGENGRPLLIKILKKDLLEPEYYENKCDNTEWTGWRSNTYVSPATLQSKLQLLNCRLNNAIIIDVSKTTNTEYDACKDDENLDPQHGNDKMQVNKDPTPDGQSLGSYSVYKHTLNNGGGKSFHIVGFQNGDTPITLTASTTPIRPILDVKEVKIYRCDTDDNSLLVYINTDNYTGKHNWYHNTDTISKTGKWVPVEGSLNTDTEPENHGEILQVLNSLDSNCKPAKEPASTQALTSLISAGATIAGYFFAGTAGSGAAGLAGWKLYKSFKQDPWVRQI